MLNGFFGSIINNNIVTNINMGLTGAITALTTSLQPAPPPPQVETPQNRNGSEINRTPNNVDPKIADLDQRSSALFGVDPDIAQAFNNAEEKKMKLFSDLIANPNQYPKLSESDKILVTQHVIQDLKRLSNTHTKPIDSIIARISVAGNNSFIDKYDASVISDYYTELYDTKKREIPVAIKIPPSFQCQRGADPRHGGAGGDTQGRRSQNAFTPPPVLFLNPRRSENHTPAQLQRSAEMRNRMHAHILSTRETEKNHPAGNKPTTNLSKQNKPQTTLTGQDARNAVLRRGGIRPTRYQSGDEKKEKELDLKNIGKKLARLEFDLSRTKIRKGNLYTAKYRPESGNHNSRRMKGYGDEGSNIKKDIETLNESLLEFYTKEERAKVDAARINELQRLNNTPSVRPSAPLVATRPSLGHLTMR